MTPTRAIETQATHAEFLSRLPAALQNRPYEISGNEVIVHDGGREIRITVHDQPVRHLGSLDLPMERIRFDFPNYTEEEADAFLDAYREHSLRAGGG